MLKHLQYVFIVKTMLQMQGVMSVMGYSLIIAATSSNMAKFELDVTVMWGVLIGCWMAVT
jgi:hypothetical protein